MTSTPGAGEGGKAERGTGEAGPEEDRGVEQDPRPDEGPGAGRGSGRGGGPGKDRRRTPTLAVHAGRADRAPGQPVVAPLVQSATFFGWGPDGGERRYSRLGNNPNQESIAAKVAAIEGTESALVLSSGMAAIAMAFLAHVDAGDHVVASGHLYGNTRIFLSDELARRGVATTFVDPDDPESWRRAARSETRVFFLELPTNPTLRVFDPHPVAEAARECGASFSVDATFASPVNFRAVEWGADVVLHSATKYLGGHSDLVAGVVAGRRDVVERIRRMMLLYGPAADPHAVWLLERGMKTLDVRVRRQNETAEALARWLETRDEVERVLYPGLPSHPDHEVASRILDGFGGMLSFVLSGGGGAADAFMRALETAFVAPSLGGVETLVSQPRLTSHLHDTEEARRSSGIPDGFVRISVGIEDIEDLREDLEAGLLAAGAAVPRS